MLSNVEKKERKYSWSTVFAWLFLKTIGRILPKRWIKWAEDILYYDKVTADQTDDLKTVDENVQKDGETTFRDMTIQTDDLMKVDASKPEVAEKENEIASEDEGIHSAAEDLSDTEVDNEEIDNEVCPGSAGDNGLIDDDYFDMEGISTEKDLNEQPEDVSLELEVDRLQNIFLEKENGELRSKNEELERENFEVTTEKEQLKLQLIEYKENLVEIRKKEEKIRDLTEISKVLKKEKSDLVSTAIKEREDSKGKLAEQKELVEQLQAKIKELWEEKRDQLAEADSLKVNLSIVAEQLKQQLLLNNQEQQRMGKELKDVDKRLEDIEKTKKSQKQTEAQRSSIISLTTVADPRNSLRKPLQDKNLGNFLSDRNMDLKKDFPEFKEKNLLFNFLKKTVKFLSNKQNDTFQGSELLHLFKINLKECARKSIENRVKDVVINKCNKYSKSIDKELLDGTMRKDELKTKLLYSVEQCMKKLGLGVQDATTITSSIVDKFYDKGNNNKSQSVLLKEIAVEELTEARMKTLLEKVKEINLASNINDIPNSSMSHINSTMFISLPNNIRAVEQR